VLLYADETTDSMRRAIDETNRRRAIQVRYNEEHGITPKSIVKPIRDLIELQEVAEDAAAYGGEQDAAGANAPASPRTGAVLTADELIGLAEQHRSPVSWDIARLLMLSPAELEQTIEALERAMRHAAGELQFEKAAALRDQINELRKGLGEPFFAPAGVRGARARGRSAARRGPRRSSWRPRA
jgi:excinuclease ABC subunit B